ncbi:hypothetical protein PCH_Pc12g08240 [Penicillium rubens Wisconsin 54-1255]|uniref:Uncharacterized protein n=1 Tax=Penicillium rubens (strain ATCC 28089 / DSM 1075 / NRRL 1951 / Wisconsin 54-1255) TaxID=500485 RepID=B6GXZ3_PENRW|nr:hypothetical protein PCH_Pc12g08240 [Penicillium rubens Wisconsin 54-1255]
MWCPKVKGSSVSREIANDVVRNSGGISEGRAPTEVHYPIGGLLMKQAEKLEALGQKAFEALVKRAKPQKHGADYSLLFGEKDHLACYVVMVEANQVGGDGHDQLLTYMAMKCWSTYHGLEYCSKGNLPIQISTSTSPLGPRGKASQHLHCYVNILVQGCLGANN